MDNQVVRARSSGKSVPDTMSICKPSPIRLRSIFGIFTRPMSSVSGACVHASAISTRDPVLAGQWHWLLPCSSRCRLCTGQRRTEKEVSRLSAGFLSYTVRNTCESVMISFGGRAKAASMASICQWYSSSPGICGPVVRGWFVPAAR